MSLFSSKAPAPGPSALKGLLKRFGSESAPAQLAPFQIERLRNGFDQAPLGIAYVAPDGQSLHVNPHFLEVIGYTREQLQRTPFRDLTHPEDAVKEAKQIRDLVAGETASYTIDKRIVQKDGTYRWIHMVTSVVRQADATPEYFVHIVNAIQERRGAEVWRGADQILVKVIDSIEELAILRTDSAGKITGWNRGAELILGYEQDEIIGKQRRVLYRDQDNWDDRPAEHLEVAARAGRSRGQDWRVTKDRRELWLESTLVTVRQDGRIAGFLEVLRLQQTPQAAVAVPRIEVRAGEAQLAELGRVCQNLEFELGARERTMESLQTALIEMRGGAEETMNELRIMTDALRKEMDRRQRAEAELREVRDALESLSSGVAVGIEEEPELLTESEMIETESPAELWEELGAAAITELYVALAAAERTGTFHLVRQEERKEILFERGTIISCATNSPGRFLTQRLIDRGLVTETQRQRALEIQKETGLALGRIFVILGVLEEETLLEIVREKMEEEIRDTLVWQEGQYCFVEGPARSIQIVPLPIDVIPFIVRELNEQLTGPHVVDEVPLIPAAPALDDSLIDAMLLAMNIDGGGELPDLGSVDPFVASSGLRSKKYHRLDCNVALRIAAKNRVTFETIPIAEDEGYQPCGICLRTTANLAMATTP